MRSSSLAACSSPLTSDCSLYAVYSSSVTTCRSYRTVCNSSLAARSSFWAVYSPSLTSRSSPSTTLKPSRAFSSLPSALTRAVKVCLRLDLSFTASSVILYIRARSSARSEVREATLASVNSGDFGTTLVQTGPFRQTLQMGSLLPIHNTKSFHNLKQRSR